jgi:phospholipid-binding lipoprotein MlaA
MLIEARNVISAAASRIVLCVALGAVSLLAACATLPPNAGSDPRDPLEKINRNVFEFNRGFDDVVLKPLAEAWEFLLPVGVRQCLGNAFFNLRGPSTMINNLLQGKPESASEDMGRFLLNSSFGLAGCFDLASMVGIELNREDFGQTLGVWGLPPGAFLMVPIFGPSSVRDAVGIYGVEPFLDLNFYIRNATFEYSVLGLRVVNERSELLQTGRLIDDAALDRYTFVRDGYLQRRRYLVHDGNPPRLPDDDLEPDDAAGPGTPPPSGGSGGGAPIRKPDVKVKTETR